MRSQTVQVDNEAMSSLKILQEPPEQEYILHHDLSCHPSFFLSPKMHASRSFAAKAVGSSLSELVLTHEHNLWQPILDLRLVTDCCNMCNG